MNVSESNLAIFLSYIKTIPKMIYIQNIIFLVGILAILYTFNYATRNILSIDLTSKYLFLNVNDPNLISMFLSNYVHSLDNLSHMTDNIYSACLFIILIFILGSMILPSFGCHMPSGFFLYNYLIFLFFLPFPISGISIWFARIMGINQTYGFSGINYAFIGLFLFLLFLFMYTKVMAVQFDKIYLPFFYIFSIMIFAITLVISMIFTQLHDPTANVYVHLGGFLLGLLVPSLIGLMLIAENGRQKTYFGLLFGLVIIVPSVMWLVMPYWFNKLGMGKAFIYIKSYQYSLN